MFRHSDMQPLTEPRAEITVARAARTLDPERTAEPPATIIRLRAVVPHEDATVTTITINRAAEFPDIRRRLHPARRLRVELAQLLQREIFLFRQKRDAHGRSHIHDAVFRFKFFP